ncbi:hypothetical protein A2U01_0075291 [Trifolium medium]|uniref:Uncharacterized protein n=1 Tax=Trifolium medium TaxID=97028 RepID=A0A392T0N1_9FABA|nr:hypothetical protein [Trifolium medium]
MPVRQPPRRNLRTAVVRRRCSCVLMNTKNMKNLEREMRGRGDEIEGRERNFF